MWVFLFDLLKLQKILLSDRLYSILLADLLSFLSSY